MVTATFRFHEGLNDFLVREQRGREFSTPCARAATTKHMIEALGVPHTEVGAVVVNGAPASLNKLIEEGDSVAVYPANGDGVPVANGRQAPRFVADAHLGGLARLLRMAGFDTLYDNNFQDNEIETLSARDDRIVLTRDRELLKRRLVARGCYVRTLKSTQQLREVFMRFALARNARPFTLCLHCNAPLRAIDKAMVQDQLPPSVRACQNEFSTCDICLRVFWQGSHWKRMCALMEEMQARPQPSLSSLSDAVGKAE
jgi:uncharacterized protein